MPKAALSRSWRIVWTRVCICTRRCTSQDRLLLEREILKRGGFISEHSDVCPDIGERLLQRNRIITACSDVLVVMECSYDSGTVDAAKRAFLQNRVLAIQWDYIPGLWRDHASKVSGNAQLFREFIAEPFPARPCRDYEEPGAWFKALLFSGSGKAVAAALPSCSSAIAP